MNISEQASAMSKMYRERLQKIVESTGASCKSPLAASWIVDTLDNYEPTTSDKVLAENWRLYYMIVRLREYHWADKKNDLHHQFNYATQAHLLAVGYHSRKFDVGDFERIMAQTADKLKN